jgi:hypothetical protein
MAAAQGERPQPQPLPPTVLQQLQPKSYTTTLLVLGMGLLFLLDSLTLSGGTPLSPLLRPPSSSSSRGGAAAAAAQPAGPPGAAATYPAAFLPGAPLPGSDAVSFNVIVTTTGRYTLPVFFDALAPQLTSADYITLISDKADWHVHVAQAFSHVRCNCTKILIENAAPLGWWGHGSRNKWQRTLPGAYHLHADDDDLYVPNAFATIRAHVRDLAHRLYIFRMIRRWDGVVNLIPPMSVTHPSQVRPRAVSTQCGVIRAVPQLYREWAYLYGGDGHFYKDLVEAFGYDNVTLVPEVIYQLGQNEDLSSHIQPLLRDPNPPPPDAWP